MIIAFYGLTLALVCIVLVVLVCEDRRRNVWEREVDELLAEVRSMLNL